MSLPAIESATVPPSGRHAAGGAGLPTVRLMGVPVHAISERGCIEHVMQALEMGSGGWIVTPNLDHLRRLVRDAAFYKLCIQADLRVADGMPLIWAARVQGTPLPERVAGSQLIWTLSAAAAEQGRSIFLLGGEPGTAEQAAQTLGERYPGLRVAGTCCPPVGFENNSDEMARLEKMLSQSQAEVIYVALGSPKQERLIAHLREGMPEAWWVGVGISFSFVCGHVRRAPRWMQRAGLEWVHRLGQEPRRLARRYLVDGLPFAARLLLSAAVGRWRSEGRDDN